MYIKNIVAFEITEIVAWVGKEYAALSKDFEEIMHKQARALESVGSSHNYRAQSGALFITDKQATPVLRFKFVSTSEATELVVMNLRGEVVGSFSWRFTIAHQVEIEKIFKEEKEKVSPENHEVVAH